MVSKVLHSSASEEWATPQWLFDMLNWLISFHAYPCATPENAKCKIFFTKEQDGLRQDWGKNIVFANVPYGREVGEWVRKCYQSSQNGALVVLLVAARTDTAWYHDWVHGKAEVHLLRGRLMFGECESPAPFPSMIGIFGRRDNRRLMKCQQCGNLFQAERTDAKTCSNACRQAMWRYDSSRKCNSDMDT